MWKLEEVELAEDPSSWHPQTVCLIPRELLCKLMTPNLVEDFFFFTLPDLQFPASVSALPADSLVSA